VGGGGAEVNLSVGELEFARQQLVLKENGHERPIVQVVPFPLFDQQEVPLLNARLDHSIVAGPSEQTIVGRSGVAQKLVVDGQGAGGPLPEPLRVVAGRAAHDGQGRGAPALPKRVLLPPRKLDAPGLVLLALDPALLFELLEKLVDAVRGRDVQGVPNLLQGGGLPVTVEVLLDEVVRLILALGEGLLAHGERGGLRRRARGRTGTLS